MRGSYGEVRVSIHVQSAIRIVFALSLLYAAALPAASGPDSPKAAVALARSLEAGGKPDAADRLLEQVVQDASVESRWKWLAAQIWAVRAMALTADPEAPPAEAVALAARASTVFQETNAETSSDAAILYDVGMCALLSGSDIDRGLTAVAAASHLQPTNAMIAELGARLSEKAHQPWQAASLWGVVAGYTKDSGTRVRATERRSSLLQNAAAVPKPEPKLTSNEPGCDGPLQRKAPQYPRDAAIARQEGWVELRFDLAADGQPINVRVMDSSPEKLFDDAAAAAFKQWSFPAAGASKKKRQGCLNVMSFGIGSRK